MSHGIALRWYLGMFFVLLISLIWIVASYVVQSVEGEGLAAFVVTFICNSLFVIYIPVVEVGWLLAGCCSTRSTKIDITFCSDNAVSHSGRPSFLGTLSYLLSRFTRIPRNESLSDGNDPVWNDGWWTRSKTAAVSLVISPFWFLAQLTFNLSLGYTSVSSNTILSSSACIITFLFSMHFLGERYSLTKLVSVILAMLGSAIYSIADAAQDPDSDGHNTLFGDILCLLSAVLYAVYTTLIRGLTPAEGGFEEMGDTAEATLRVHPIDVSEEPFKEIEKSDETHGLVDGVEGSGSDGSHKFSTALMFGYIGLWNFLLFLPVGLFLHHSYPQKFAWPTLSQWGLVLGKGLFDNVLSDYLWARAVLLTTPTAATTALQIQMPMAVVSDAVLNHVFPNGMQIMGAFLVVLGFLGINLDVHIL